MTNRRRHQVQILNVAFHLYLSGCTDFTGSTHQRRRCRCQRTARGWTYMSDTSLPVDSPMFVYSLTLIVILFTVRHCSNYYKLHNVGNWFAENVVQRREHTDICCTNMMCVFLRNLLLDKQENFYYRGTTLLPVLELHQSSKNYFTWFFFISMFMKILDDECCNLWDWKSNYHKMFFNSIVSSDLNMMDNSNTEINNDMTARQSWPTNGQ